MGEDAGASRPGIVLLNANVITLDAHSTRATALAILGGRIVWVGDGVPPPESVGAGSRRVDCGGATVLPGFIDPHCHPLALGSALAGVDCGPDAVGAIRGICERLARAARREPGEGWIVGRGYDELRLAEGRHPTRHDLDAAVPDRPVRLEHGSGHAVVLNSRALDAVGVTRDTAPPAGGVIERDPETGEATGVLYEMAAWLRERLPRPAADVLRAHARRASDALLAAGVTSVADAGPANDASRLELYRRLHADGDFIPRVIVMLRPDVAPDAVASASGPPAPVRAGAAKIVLGYATGSLQPGFDELLEALRAVHARGQQAAVHAIEADAVLMACEAFRALGSAAEIRAARHRIEHAAECPPEVARAIADCGAAVVTQPGFIHGRGDRYLAAEADGESPAEELYAVRALLEAGVPVAASSDAPTGPLPPLLAISAAVTRRAASGRLVGPEQAVSVGEALRLVGPAAAWAQREETVKGTLEAGKLADLVVLDSDLSATRAGCLADLRVRATVIGGEIAWGALW